MTFLALRDGGIFSAFLTQINPHQQMTFMTPAEAIEAIREALIYIEGLAIDEIPYHRECIVSASHHAFSALAMLENPWQPIETAPRDGTRVLIALYECNQERWVDIAKYGNETPLGCITKWQNAYGQGYAWRPTHWMPLQLPPQERAMT